MNSNNICLGHRSMLCLHLSKVQLELYFDVLNIFPLSSHEVPNILCTPSFYEIQICSQGSNVPRYSK
jgi:hypothetical protein